MHAVVEASARRRTPKAFAQGTHRTCTPEATYARVRSLFAPLGITRVSNVTGLDAIGIPVTMATRPNARSISVSPGKGLDLAAAKASAAMEAIELYHAERPELDLRLATYDELRLRASVAGIERLPRVSLSRLTPATNLLWCAGFDLAAGAQLWLPYELVHTNFTLPLPSCSGCFVMGSNGLASGNHVLEAVTHGLCELIERDAHACFRALAEEDRDARQIDASSIRDPMCARLLEKYAAAGVAIAIWDLTSDVGVPAFQCVVLESDPNPFRSLGPVEGLGCHPTREVALARALTEAAQGRLTLIAGVRDDHATERHAQTHAPSVVGRARLRLQRGGNRRFDEVVSHEHDTFEDELAFLLKSLQGAGFDQIICVDLTKPALGIPVVRCVVPGLEGNHQTPGYVPGPRVAAIIEGRLAAGRS